MISSCESGATEDWTRVGIRFCDGVSTPCAAFGDTVNDQIARYELKTNNVLMFEFRKNTRV